MIIHDSRLKMAPLGKRSKYVCHYSPDLLFPVPRKLKRDELGIQTTLPFWGYDIWNAFELSWLNPKGKPVVAMAEFHIPCESPNIVESKSLKLYLNSFNSSHFESTDQVSKIIHSDLTKAAGSIVKVKVFGLGEARTTITRLAGRCLDDLDIEIDRFEPNPGFLTVSDVVVEDRVFSDLLKTNCLVTGQPDWGSVQIQYRGRKIDDEGLLKYIVSLRDHNEFHEQCVERMYTTLLTICQPEKLAVFARYTRRGGLDINPYRTNYPVEEMDNTRLIRQ